MALCASTSTFGGNHNGKKDTDCVRVAVTFAFWADCDRIEQCRKICRQPKRERDASKDDCGEREHHNGSRSQRLERKRIAGRETRQTEFRSGGQFVLQHSRV